MYELIHFIYSNVYNRRIQITDARKMTKTLSKFQKIPDREPPSSTVGMLAWIRINLFGTTTNTITTLLFLYLIYLFLPPFLDWAIFNANISGNDRSVCDENKSGARWTFVKVRFEQLYLAYILLLTQTKYGDLFQHF